MLRFNTSSLKLGPKARWGAGLGALASIGAAAVIATGGAQSQQAPPPPPTVTSRAPAGAGRG